MQIGCAPMHCYPQLQTATATGRQLYQHPWDRLGFWIVWFLAFAIPWGDMIQLPYQVQASRVLSLIAGAFWFFAIVRGRAVRVPGGAFWWMLLFVIWSAANLAWTPEPEKSVRRILSYSQLFLVTALVHQSARTLRDYQSLLAAYLYGSFVCLGGQLLNFLRGNFTGDGRFTAPSFDPNDLAITLVLGILIAWFLAFRCRVYVWLAFLYIPLAIAGTLMTASRGALVTLAVCLLYCASTLPSMRWRSVVPILAVVFVSVGGLFLVKGEIAFHRLRTITREVSARDLNGRVDIWERGINAFLERPIVGVGAGAFGIAVGAWRSRDLAAHNTFLGILVEHGIVGLAIYIGIVISLYARSRRGNPIACQFWFFALLSWIVAISSLSWENRELTWLLWGFCLADPLVGWTAKPKAPVWRGYARQAAWV